MGKIGGAVEVSSIEGVAGKTVREGTNLNKFRSLLLVWIHKLDRMALYITDCLPAKNGNYCIWKILTITARTPPVWAIESSV